MASTHGEVRAGRLGGAPAPPIPSTPPQMRSWTFRAPPVAHPLVSSSMTSPPSSNAPLDGAGMHDGDDPHAPSHVIPWVHEWWHGMVRRTLRPAPLPSVRERNRPRCDESAPVSQGKTAGLLACHTVRFAVLPRTLPRGDSRAAGLANDHTVIPVPYSLDTSAHMS